MRTSVSAIETWRSHDHDAFRSGHSGGVRLSAYFVRSRACSNFLYGVLLAILRSIRSTDHCADSLDLKQIQKKKNGLKICIDRVDKMYH